MSIRGASSRPPARAARILGATIVGTFLTDLASKTWALDRLTPGRSISLGLGMRLVHARNTGVAFSRGQGFAGIIVPILVVIGLVAWTARSEFTQPGGPRRWAPIGYGLILGGALGNVADRLFRSPGWGKGAVIDMIDVGFWPVFNVADAALCVGVAITVLTLLRQPGTNTRQTGTDAAASDTAASDIAASDTAASDTAASDTAASDTAASDTAASNSNKLADR